MSTGATRRAPVRVRVATLNLLHGLDVRSGRVDLEATASALAQLDLDVVALQEVDRGLARSGGEAQASALGARLGMEAVFAPALLGDPDRRWVSADRDDGGPAYGVALLSRLPLGRCHRTVLPGGGDGQRRERRPSSSPPGPGWDREPRVALTVAVSTGGTGLTVTTMHLSYLPWRAVAQLRRAARAATAGAGPGVLAGDCNLPPWAVRAVLGRRWSAAGGAPTYPAWQPRMQVDQVAVTTGAAVEDVAVLPAGPGDHLAVVATLRLPGPDGRSAP